MAHLDTMAEPSTRGVEECFLVTRDGRRLHVLDYAGPTTRTPLVCIPGLRSNLRSFETIAPRVAKTRRVVCVGLRGRGRSDWDREPGRYGLKTEISDVYFVTHQLGISRAVLLGVSRGGFTALALAARTGMAAGLVFVDSGPQIESAGMIRFGPDLARDVSFPNWNAAAASLKARHSAWSSNMSDEDWRAIARQLYREDNGRVVIDSDQGIGDSLRARNAAHPSGGSWSAWPMFESVPLLPMLVLRCEFSDFVLESTVARMKDMKADVVVATIRGRGHPPAMTEPDMIAAIDSFLRTIP